MNLTRDHLPLLKSARFLLDEGRDIFICLAVGEVLNPVESAHVLPDLGLSRDALGHLAWEITYHIGCGIAPYSTLDEWLFHSITGLDSDSSHLRSTPWYWRLLQPSNEHRCQIRVAWLDRIIWDIEHVE